MSHVQATLAVLGVCAFAILAAHGRLSMLWTLARQGDVAESALPGHAELLKLEALSTGIVLVVAIVRAYRGLSPGVTVVYSWVLYGLVYLAGIRWRHPEYESSMRSLMDSSEHQEPAGSRLWHYLAAGGATLVAMVLAVVLTFLP